ncbi:MAG TPA: hypothetical protein VJP86_08550 [Vicinamibacterales bacterium]|nr:hypothetical protein [Vicinamibacterales bacterium]
MNWIQDSPPIIVKVIEPATDPTGLAEVLLGAARVTAVWAVAAVALGVVLARLLFWLRSRSES